MEMQELRIGNYIRYRDEWDCEVQTIGSCFETHNKDLNDRLHGILCGSDDIRDYSPIPLTEEWLARLGFKKTRELTYEGLMIGLPVVFRVCYGEFYIGFKDVYLGSRIKHVHEYQNLYFALTGQEITIKN